MDLGRTWDDLKAIGARVGAGALRGARAGAAKGLVAGPLGAAVLATVFALGGAKDGLASVGHDAAHDLQASLDWDSTLRAGPPPAESVCGAPPDVPLPPDTPGTVRFFAGGNSHDDDQGVLPWAFARARERHAAGFFFLGDMEHAQLRPETDDHFTKREADLGPVPLYPVAGNHEVRRFALLHPGALGFVDKLPGFDTEAAYKKRFFGTERTPVEPVDDSHATYYSTDLAGSVHFVSLDNVSQKGFGRKQLAWLAQDLASARARGARHLVVGAHMPLAKNGVTQHGMDEDGPVAAQESDEALALFQKAGVEVILHAHLHEYAAYAQGGIPVYISGGLGAYLPRADIAKELAPQADPCFHHVLELDVSDSGVAVTRLIFSGGR